MKKLTTTQLDYLQSERRLARLATADEHGRPQVTPVGMWQYNEELGTIDVSGRDLQATRKFRNVTANPQSALVVDDIASIDPWRPRAVIIEGPTEAIPADASGNSVLRITPDKIISWGLDAVDGG
jgi:pyridoxamine 5'-phosphate oxidase family protein